jgi:ABC-type dipeptide/oligopeptide/nickel transport system permease component
VTEALPITLLLNVVTLPIVYGVAITAGIHAARHRGGWFDVSSGVLFIALWSLPIMWVGVMMLGFLANRDFIHLFPTGGVHDTAAEQMSFLPSRGESGFHRGWFLDTVWHLILPVVCLTYGSFAFLSKLTRASMLENLSAEFARTARAKGVTERVILFRHVLRNSVIPLITIASGILPGMLGGSVVVEYIFSIRGMGSLMIESIKANDNEIVLSVTLIGAILGTVSLLLADLGYAIADPRVSYE